MRIIHCADLHLDPAMSAITDRRKAAERKRELLMNFERMVSFAVAEGVGAILIAGDMFDRGVRSVMAENTVMTAISEHPDIHFYYLAGNHDQASESPLPSEECRNLFGFQGGWQRYVEAGGKIVITGAEAPAWGAVVAGERMGAPASGITEFDKNSFNILMLHGQLVRHAAETVYAAGSMGAEVIDLRLLAGRGIDYLALGHVHSFQEGMIDGRGKWCYPGCLEGRGFDECGEHGFVLLDIDEVTGKYEQSFVPFAKRRVYDTAVDVSGCRTTLEMIKRAEAALIKSGCSSDSLVRIRLNGRLAADSEKDLGYIEKCFTDRYYYLKIKDETTYEIEPESYMDDISLKGEFIRQVMSMEEYSEEDRSMIIRYGLQALAGEEIG